MTLLLPFLSAFACGFVVGLGALAVYSMMRLSGNISEQERRNGREE